MTRVYTDEERRSRRRAKQREYSRRWREANPESQREHVRAWKAANRERQREYWRKWYAANAAENAEKNRAKSAAWRASNPVRAREKEFANANLRRARLVGAAVGETVDRAAVVESDASTCYLCGKHCEAADIHLDHVVPLSRGGQHVMANLRVTHAACNMRKGARLVSECAWAIPYQKEHA